MLYHNRTPDDDYASGSDEDNYNLHGFDQEVRRSVAILREHADKFDVIAVRGMSGVVMGAPLSLLLKKELFIVRKPDDDCHQFEPSFDGTEAQMTKTVNAAAVRGGARCLFLDDFEAGGNTRMATERVVDDRGGIPVGKFMYDGSMDAPIFYGGSAA